MKSIGDTRAKYRVSYFYIRLALIRRRVCKIESIPYSFSVQYFSFSPGSGTLPDFKRFTVRISLGRINTQRTTQVLPSTYIEHRLNSCKVRKANLCESFPNRLDPRNKTQSVWKEWSNFLRAFVSLTSVIKINRKSKSTCNLLILRDSSIASLRW